MPVKLVLALMPTASLQIHNWWWVPSRAHFTDEALEAQRWMNASGSQQVEPRGTQDQLLWEACRAVPLGTEDSS